jgi:hypothetical protein
MKTHTSSMKEESAWMFKVDQIPRTEISSCGTNIMASTNNGISFMLKT